MKKNSKKIKTPPKSSAKKRFREEIRHLGFVVDTDIVGPKALTHALVNLKQDRSSWYVVNLNAGQHSSKTKDSIGKYVRTVFFLAVKAWLCYEKKGEIEKNAIIVRKDDSRFAKIGADLRNWARVDKVKNAFEDFPMLRMAIHNSLFAGSGAHQPLNVIWKGERTPNAIFFWSSQKLQNIFSSLEPDVLHQKVKIKNLTPETELPPESLDILATSFAYSDRGNTWQDLYRKALENSLSSDIFIELLASQITPYRKVEEQSKNRSSQSELFKSNTKPDAIGVLKILENNKKVLLIGPSGSGKTTTLQHISRLFAFGERKIEGQEVLPVVVPMKWFGIWPKERKNPPTISAYIAFWIRKTIYDYVEISDLQKCNLFMEKKSQQLIHGNREKMLEKINQQVEAFLIDSSTDLSNFVFLFDAYDEIPRTEKYNADQQFNKFLQQIDKYVISSRAYDKDKVLPYTAKFEIQDLNDNQISDYLTQCLMEKGEEVFTNQIKKSPEVLSMAQNPYYLFLIAQEIKKNPNTKIPSNRAELIQNFIMDSIERRSREEAHVNDNIMDDLIYLVLSKVAKWSIDITTASKSGEFLPFTKSQQFKEFQGSYNDVYRSLAKAESYGILKFSGLLQSSREHFGYPEFLHDNIRFFFAAIYLMNIDAEELQKRLPSFLEYFAWDEPFLQFLELNPDEDLTKQIIDYVIPKDIVLASLCIRHARIMDEDICIKYERRIRNSELYKQIEPLIQHTISHTCTRKLQRTLLINVLSRLPIAFLLKLINEPCKDGPSGINLWAAVAENITADDLVWLKDLWSSLPKKSLVDRFCILYAIASIPAYDAFKTFVNIYKYLQQNQEDDPELARFFESAFLTLISYSPSLSELASEFPLENSSKEFRVILPKVRKAFGDELVLLKKLMFDEDIFVSTEACRLFIKSADKNSFPALIDWLMANIANPVKIYPELQVTILDFLQDVAPDETVKKLTDSIKGKHGYIQDLTYWKALAKMQTRDTLKHFVRCLSGNRPERLSYFCADQLEIWPKKNDVLSEFESYTKKHISLLDGTILFGALLSIDKFLPQVPPLFDKIYSSVVLGRTIESPPIDLQLEEYFKSIDKDWCLQRQQDKFKNNLSLLPIAIRAVQEYSTEVIKKFLRIIQWANESLSSEEKYPAEVLFESITQAILKLTTLAKLNRSSKIIDYLLSLNIFENILSLIQKGGGHFYTYENEQYSNEKLESALIRFCDTVPNVYVPQLLLLSQKMFINSITQPLLGKESNLEVLPNIILCLCNRADHSFVSKSLQFLYSKLSVADAQENCDNIVSLIEKIKLAKRRRFLSISDMTNK